MTKKYDVITLDGFIYLIDNEAKAKPNDHTIGFGRVVIASNNPSIDAPQIGELPEEEDIYDTVIPPSVDKGDGIEQHYFDLGYWEGYKAAKAKKWTDEDMRKAIWFGWNLSVPERNATISYKDILQPRMDKWLQSLTKPIKSITIEMEAIAWVLPEVHHTLMEAMAAPEIRPKLKDGYVIIKEVEYE